MFSWNRLHTGVKALFFVQIVNRMGDFVVPFLTLIMTQVQGFSPAAAGLVVTLTTALESLGGLVAGRLSDRHSRRDVLIVFLAMSGILLAGAGLAPASLGAAMAMVASGFFIGAMRPVLGALVADLTDEGTRRAAYSLSYLGINLGVSIGPLLACWLFQNALSWMFWLDALSTAAALAILALFVPRTTQSFAAAPLPRDGSALTAFFHHPLLLPFSLLLMVYNFVYSQMVFTQALQLVSLFGDQGPQVFGLVWAINAVTVLVLTPMALRMTKNWTNLASMAVGMEFFALGTSVFLLHPGLALVVVSTILWTTGEVLFSIHMGDLVSAQSPPDRRGRFQAYVGFLGSLGFVVSPLASGLVAQLLGLTGIWWLSTFLAAAVGAGFAGLTRRTTAPLSS